VCPWWTVPLCSPPRIRSAIAVAVAMGMANPVEPFVAAVVATRPRPDVDAAVSMPITAPPA